MKPQRFLGAESPGPETHDAVILPLSYEGTVSYGTGTAHGPLSVLDIAPDQLEKYDMEFQCRPCERAGMFVLPAVAGLTGTPEEVHRTILEATRAAAREEKDAQFFVGLGGEHSVTFPFVQGLLEEGFLQKDVGILQIDAHTDLRDEYDGTKFSHACVMRRLRDDLGLQTVHVGIRAMGDDEPAYIQQENVPIFPAPFHVEQISAILDALPETVFISFDVDVLDPSIMPATGTPVPGGLQWFEALTLLRRVFEGKNVPAMDIVEFAPIPGMHAPTFLVAQLLYKCLGYRFCAKEN